MERILNISKSGYYISNKIYKTPSSPQRTVTGYELEFITTSGHTSIINGESYVQEYGNILIASPNDTRFTIGSFECYYVHFTTECSEIKDKIKEFPKVFKVSREYGILDIFNNLISPLSLRAGDSLRAAAGVLEILAACSDTHSLSCENEKNSRYIESIFRARKFIEDNFEEHITLSDIAASAHLSPGFLHGIFKESTGNTPAEYLLDIRLSYAKSMLINTDTPLSEVALCSGFGSQAYFCYAFKKHIGTTPAEYRRLNRPIF